MNGKERKTSPTTIILIVGFAVVLVLIIFALFSSSPSTFYSSKNTLTVKLWRNTSLKSNSYFDLNFTIINSYDFPLENVKVWLEGGKLFTIALNPLSNITTLRSYSYISSKANVTYFIGALKVEKIESEMKDVPIIMKVLFEPKISKNFTINVVNNNSLQLYGGIANIGIKEVKKISASPLSLSFSSDPKNFIFEEGKRNFAPLKILIENSGGGKCIDEIRMRLHSSSNLACVYNNSKLIAPFETFLLPTNKIEIPCNFTLSYLRGKDFDSIASEIQLSCSYLEEKTFKFDITP